MKNQWTVYGGIMIAGISLGASLGGAVANLWLEAKLAPDRKALSGHIKEWEGYRQLVDDRITSIKQTQSVMVGQLKEVNSNVSKAIAVIDNLSQNQGAMVHEWGPHYDKRKR